MEDRSLTDFSPDEGQSEDSSSRERKRDTDTTVELPTSDWVRDGSECQQCGTRVARRWRDNGQMVCTDCKNWE